MPLCKINSDGYFGELWRYELILEPVVNLCSRPNVTVSITCPEGPFRDTVETDISFYQRWQDSLTLSLFSNSLLCFHSRIPPRKEKDSSFSVVWGL